MVSEGHYFAGNNEGKVGIRGYTVTQFENFLDAIEEKQKNERFDRIEEIALAARTIFSKFENVSAFLKGLRNNGKRK